MKSIFRQRGFLEAALPSIVSGLFGFGGQSSANRANARENAINREFQERMSNTSYQRGMADMEAAGLNPMLAYSQGGASVPTGNTAVYGNSGAAFANAFSQTYNAISGGTSAQANMMNAENATKLGNETVAKTKQEISNLQSDQQRVIAYTKNLSAEYQNLIKSGKNLDEINLQIRATIDKMKAEIPLINTQTFATNLQGLLNQANTALAKAQTNNTNFDTELKKAQTTNTHANTARAAAGTLLDLTNNRIATVEANAAEAFGELGKTVGALRPFLELLWNATKR